MEEALRKKLESYFTAPADAPVTVKFAGWTQSDFDALGKIQQAVNPKNYAEFQAFKNECLKSATTNAE
ncbi:MAG: hypothetical protein ACI361_01090 [Atopobiaceae bacterium]